MSIALSSSQRRAWILHELEPGGQRLALGLRLAADRDPRAIAAAWQACVSRHAVLRSCFPMRGVAPAVELLPAAALAARLEQAASEPSGDEAHAWLEDEISRPFDPAHGPLVRLAILSPATGGALLALTAHQSVCDERSLRRLLDELLAPSERESGEMDFASFASAQESWLGSVEATSELEFWKSHLAGAPAALELPSDHPRSTVQGYRRGSIRVDLPETAAAAFDGGSAPRPVLVTAMLAALLHRYTGEEDLVLGWSPRADRGAPGPVGPCDEALVVRVGVDATTTVRGLVAALRAAAELTLAHRRLPFSRLIEAVAARRDLGHTPLFQVLIAESPARACAGGDELLVQDLAPSRCDLTMIIEDPAAARVRLDYNAALFDHATIARLARHLRWLVAAASADPDERIGVLPLHGADEGLELIEAWNATAVQVPPPSLTRLVDDRAAGSPDALAVVHGDATLTYRELTARADRLARRLRQAGVGANGVVGLCLDRSPEAMVAVLAVLKAGGAYLPLDPAYPAERIDFMLRDAKASVLLAHRRLLARLPETAAAILAIDELDLETPAERDGAEAPDADIGADRLAYLIYTSGSTGVPKGIAMPHGPLANLIAWQLGRSQAGAGSRTLQYSSLSFDVSFQELFSTWASGGTLVLVDETVRRDPIALLRLLAGARIDRLFLPFVALQQLAEAAAAEPSTMTRLKEVITAGEQLRVTPSIRAWFAGMPGCTLHNHYGPSESHVVTAHDLDGDPATWPELPPIGRPIANARIYLLDGERRPVPIGVAGELWIAGPVLARGYLGRTELTAERFLPDPYRAAGTMYRSGDLARRRADGAIEFLGRRDQQVKLRGFRIELGEIEGALSAHPLVREAAAAVRDDGSGDRRLLAYVVAAESRADLATELRRFLQQRLPDHLVPAAIAVLPRMPLTPSGKLDRRALPMVSPPQAAAAFAAPLPGAEHDIAEAWRAVLRLERIGRDDNVFDLGGHSLHLIQVHQRLRAALGRDVPIAMLFLHPTVASLAGALASGAGAAAASTILLPLQTRGSRTPFFCISGFFDIGRHVGGDQPFYGLDIPAEIMTSAHPPSMVEVAGMAIAAMRSVQPSGPYLLGGHCFGAIVAFAIANRLQAMGEEVRLLALMDPPNPPQYQAQAQFVDRVRFHVRNLLRRGPLAQVRYLGQRLRNISKRLSESGEDDDADLYKDFAPAVHRGNLALFLAKDTFLRLRPERDPRLMWRHLASEGLTCHELPGDHVTFCREPLVSHLGAAVRACLDRAVACEAVPG